MNCSPSWNNKACSLKEKQTDYFVCMQFRHRLNSDQNAPSHVELINSLPGGITRNLDLKGFLKCHLSTKPAAVGLVSQKPDICSRVNTRGEEKLYVSLQYVVHSDLLLLLMFPILCIFVFRYKTGSKEEQVFMVQSGWAKGTPWDVKTCWAGYRSAPSDVSEPVIISLRNWENKIKNIIWVPQIKPVNILRTCSLGQIIRI